jgi:hypothetical protein
MTDALAGTSSADEQLTHLRRAALAYGEWLESHPEPDSEALSESYGELAAKGDHLAACAAAVDAMCCKGDLPADWAEPYWRRRWSALTATDGQVTTFGSDPRVTAAGGAAAKAGWELAVPPATDGRFWGKIELPGYRSYTGWITDEQRFGVQMAVVRDWDGREIAAVTPGPNSPVIRLPTPLQRPGRGGVTAPDDSYHSHADSGYYVEDGEDPF